MVGKLIKLKIDESTKIWPTFSVNQQKLIPIKIEESTVLYVFWNAVFISMFYKHTHTLNRFIPIPLHFRKVRYFHWVQIVAYFAFWSQAPKLKFYTLCNVKFYVFVKIENTKYFIRCFSGKIFKILHPLKQPLYCIMIHCEISTWFLPPKLTKCIQ